MAIPAQTIIPLIVACSLFMETLDSTIIATALPTIARSLDEEGAVEPVRLADPPHLHELRAHVP